MSPQGVEMSLQGVEMSLQGVEMSLQGVEMSLQGVGAGGLDRTPSDSAHGDSKIRSRRCFSDPFPGRRETFAFT